MWFIEVTNNDAWFSDGIERATITSTHGGRANHNDSLVFENWGSARGYCLFPQKYQLNCTLQKRQLETKVILATTDLAGSVIALAWWSWSYSSLMVPRRRTVFAAFSAGRPLILAAYMLKMGWLALFPSPQKNMTGYVEEVEAVLRIQHYIIYTNTNVKISIKATSFCWVATTWVPQTDKANQ